MLLTTPNLTAPHGFSLRAGGVSAGVYAGLNLDDRPLNGHQDDPLAVAENRARLTAALGFGPQQLSRLDQVHGLDVVRARAGVQTADAQVTDQPGLLLAIGTADCYPLLLEDPDAGVLGAAHAGWRGTLGDIAGRSVRAMTALGARPERIRAAVGPGICAAQYQVGPEVAARFEEADLGEFVTPGLQLDLCAANLHLLTRAGLRPEHLWASGRCSTEPDFYSYRRDGGVTGRMWAVIGALDVYPDAAYPDSGGTA
ncbi:polyphenol oxidase family protein [Deinococcus sp.]|uniref:polyphenol oxidase family protein n=1 Tax=Deinococcus sp. TaxID=47478 RepID=UPI003CC50408